MLNQIARIDAELKVGQVSQTIEVSGAAPVLKTESTQIDTIINASTNDNLPLASRNYVQLTLLAPGSVPPDPSSFNNGNNTGGYGGRPLINGNREQANYFLLDGWIITRSRTTSWIYPSPGRHRGIQPHHQ